MVCETGSIHLCDDRLSKQRDLINSAYTVDDHGLFAAERHQRGGKWRYPPSLGDTEEVCLGVSWIDEGSEKVENRSYADLLTRLEHGAHCRMKLGREHEPDTDLFDGIFDLVWRLRQVHAETFKHVGTTAVAGNGSISVFCNCDACTGCD